MSLRTLKAHGEREEVTAPHPAPGTPRRPCKTGETRENNGGRRGTAGGVRGAPRRLVSCPSLWHQSASS